MLSLTKPITTKSITGFLGIIIPICALIFILDIPILLTGKTLFNQQYLAIFWALVSAIVFLKIPASRKKGDEQDCNPELYDFILAGLAMIVGFYVAFFYPELLFTIGLPSPLKVVLGALAVLLIFEAVRRLAGWPIIVIIIMFILYARFGYLFSGMLEIKPSSWSRLITMLYLGDDFFLGTPLRVTALIVFPFILFGQVLIHTGGGNFLMQLSQACMGRYRGGPAKVAVLASSFFGSISGSAVANVASTGMITIPMMKKTGFRPEFAGAVESVASTGGIILPPIMGAVAFVMADFLGVSYATVVIAALVPALLYYLGLYLQIDFRAARRGLNGRLREELPDIKQTIMEGWHFFIPILFLVYFLFFLRMSPQIAAFYSTLCLFIVAIFKKEIRKILSWKLINDILQSTSRAVFEVTVICAAAGLVVGLISYTGLGFSLSFFLTKAAGGNLLVLGIFSAITSLILGMGMPSVACYILLAVLVAPAMCELGVEPLAAHLFILYYGILSFITPPVALAVYAASSIAGAPAMRIAFSACKLAIAGFIVPFIFIYNSHLLMIGTPVEVVKAIFDGVLAIVMLAASIEGYLLRKLHWLERIIFLVGAIAMFAPGWFSSTLGLIIAFSMFITQLIASRKKVCVGQEEHLKKLY